MKAFTVMGRVLKATYEELFLCVYLSVLWWLGQLLVVTAAPAMMGLNRVSNRVANYKRVDNSYFWEGARTEIAKGWLLYAIFLAAPIAIAFNFWFYIRVDGWLRAFAIFWLWAFVTLLMVGQYVFPLMWQQDNPSIKLALRNSALLVARNPLYSFLMLLFELVLIALGIGLTLPLVLLTPAMLSLCGNFALNGLLQEMNLAPEPPVITKK